MLGGKSTEETCYPVTTRTNDCAPTPKRKRYILIKMHICPRMCQKYGTLFYMFIVSMKVAFLFFIVYW